MKFNFEHGKVYYYGYDGGYIIRIDKEVDGLISVLSYIYLEEGYFCGKCDNFANISQETEGTREATQKEIARLEKAENYKYKLNYEIY